MSNLFYIRHKTLFLTSVNIVQPFYKRHFIVFFLKKMMLIPAERLSFLPLFHSHFISIQDRPKDGFSANVHPVGVPLLRVCFDKHTFSLAHN